jgi:hypothetical protein
MDLPERFSFQYAVLYAIAYFQVLILKQALHEYMHNRDFPADDVFHKIYHRIACIEMASLQFFFHSDYNGPCKL